MEIQEKILENGISIMFLFLQLKLIGKFCLEKSGG